MTTNKVNSNFYQIAVTNADEDVTSVTKANQLTTARQINGVNFNGTADITVTAAAGTLTGTTLNATVVGSSLQTVGNVTSGTWSATSIDAQYGGTGQTAYTVGDILYCDTANTLSKLPIGTTGYVLTANNGKPQWLVSTGGVSSFQTSLSGLTPNSTTTGAITLAGTLGAISGGTGQTTFAAGDLLYCDTANTLSKLSIGTSGQVLTVSAGKPAWASGGGGGGASFVVGTVIPGPTAPSDGGTWLECNGQSVSQTTYSSLYGIIGHQYLKYKLSRYNAPTNIAATSVFCYSGTAWITMAQSSTIVQKSTDGGQTWTSVTSLPAAFTTGAPNSWTDSAGTCIFWATGSTTAYKTTNDGASWTTVTLPVSAISYMGNNGSNLVALRGASNAIYYSSDLGSTWLTSASTLPATIANGARGPWYSSTSGKWYFIDVLSTTNVVRRFETTSSTGTTGWTTVYINITQGAGNGGANLAVINGTDTILSAYQSNIQISTDVGGTSANTAFITPNNFYSSIEWNGLHFIRLNNNLYSFATVLANGKFSNDSLAWGTNITYTTSISGLSVNSPVTVSGGVADTVNYRVVGRLNMAVTTGGITNYTGVIEPNINTSTNFNLPNYTFTVYGSNNLSTKAWIKAA